MIPSFTMLWENEFLHDTLDGSEPGRDPGFPALIVLEFHDSRIFEGPAILASGCEGLFERVSNLP